MNTNRLLYPLQNSVLIPKPDAFAGNLGINSKSFNPAAILKAFIIPGTVNPDATDGWREMSFNVK